MHSVERKEAHKQSANKQTILEYKYRMATVEIIFNVQDRQKQYNLVTTGARQFTHAVENKIL